MEKRLGVIFLKASLIYFTISVTMGVIISIRPIYEFIILSTLFERAHAHISLIGWVSLSIIGLIYYSVLGNKPLYNEKLGNMGFWLINIGIISEFIALIMGGYAQASSFKAGDFAMEHTSMYVITMLIIIFAVVIMIGVYISIYNIYKTLGRPETE
ncbi:MAG: hypothetical protein FIB07_17405 [Candidatus Methanoperedens sp.]|nr:hypothetical protein [Candidatus Methanoperedens sp.]